MDLGCQIFQELTWTSIHLIIIIAIIRTNVTSIHLVVIIAIVRTSVITLNVVQSDFDQDIQIVFYLIIAQEQVVLLSLIIFHKEQMLKVEDMVSYLDLTDILNE